MAAFFSDAAAQDASVRAHDIEKLLEASDGLIRLENFLPAAAAEAVLAAVKAMGNWESADGQQDSSYADAIQHRFHLAELDGFKEEEEEEPSSTLSRHHKNVLRGCGRLLWRLYRPAQTTPNFTAACYRKGDHIAPHDDLVEESYGRAESARLRRYFEKGYACGARSGARSGSQEGPEGEEENESSESSEPSTASGGPGEGGAAAEDVPVPFVRELACVLYLNKDWDARRAGGHFLDLKTGRKHAPLFNTLVVFRVPRMHAVEAVRGKDREGVQRLSLFGWWLREEKPKTAKAAMKKKKKSSAAEKRGKGAMKTKKTAPKKKKTL